MKKILIGFIALFILVALAGMYKFNYLANQPGYDVDGNKMMQENGQKFTDKIGMTDSMNTMPCHKMGNMWMGKCEKDAQGNVIPPNKSIGDSHSDNLDETFSHHADEVSEFPTIEPTKLVQLKDGDRFEMVAEMVQQEVGNRTIKRLAYNRQIPGPIIEVEKDAKITIILTNKLDVNTTLHSHGLRLEDDSFDGVPDTMGGKQPEMKPGESFSYELTFPDSGVFWYHPHIREDYTQEMGLYGNYHVTQENYWNEVDREEFLVVDDFSENDPFYRDLTNKTLMGRFGNILLINNQENFSLKAKTGENIRFYVTNTANTRTFDLSIFSVGAKKLVPLQIVGGDIGRIEKEVFADNFVIAPAERIIFEKKFNDSGRYLIEHRGKKIGEIIVEGESGVAQNLVPDTNILRENSSDYAIIRDNFQKFLDAPLDKKLRLSIGMKGRGEMKMGNNMKDSHDDQTATKPDGIEWEDDMKEMNSRSNTDMIEWMLIDETDMSAVKKNMEIFWKFKKDDFVKIEIFNDPSSMHPMQHPLHFHGQRFVVLTRDGIPNKNLQWKDTSLIKTGERVEILLNTTNVGTWMSHCHIAEHLHAGMMLMFEVE